MNIAVAQTINISKEIGFVQVLIAEKEYRKSIQVSNVLQSHTLKKEQRDSLTFFQGWSYYNIKSLDSSSAKLNDIDTSSAFYFKAKYYSALCNAYQGRAIKSIQQINQIEKPFTMFPELQDYALASYYLINRDVNKFDSVAHRFTYMQFPFAKEEKNLFKSRETILKQKNRSPFVAGALSALVPGLGKYYAGYKGQAISALLPTAFFAAFTAESYYRIYRHGSFKNAGVRLIPFIAFGGAFSVFYIGNIIGSAKSVKTFKERNRKIIDNEILLDLHIAQRRIFD